MGVMKGWAVHHHLHLMPLAHCTFALFYTEALRLPLGEAQVFVSEGMRYRLYRGEDLVFFNKL